MRLGHVQKYAPVPPGGSTPRVGSSKIVFTRWHLLAKILFSGSAVRGACIGFSKMNCKPSAEPNAVRAMPRRRVYRKRSLQSFLRESVVDGEVFGYRKGDSFESPFLCGKNPYLVLAFFNRSLPEIFEQLGQFQGSLAGASTGGFVPFFTVSGSIRFEHFQLLIDLVH